MFFFYAQAAFLLGLITFSGVGRRQRQTTGASASTLADKKMRRDDHSSGFNFPFTGTYPAFLPIWVQSLLPDQYNSIL